MSEKKPLEMEQQPITLAPDENVKIVITQKIDGTLVLDAKGQTGNVDLYHMVGLIEATKSDILTKTSGDQAMVEIVMDELDMELNPNTTLKVGDKIPVPVSVAEARIKSRDQSKSS